MICRLRLFVQVLSQEQNVLPEFEVRDANIAGVHLERTSKEEGVIETGACF